MKKIVMFEIAEEKNRKSNTSRNQSTSKIFFWKGKLENDKNDKKEKKEKEKSVIINLNMIESLFPMYF